MSSQQQQQQQAQQQASSNMHNLTTLIKRLEAATSRLEDMATSTFSAEESQKSGDGSVQSSSPQQSRDSVLAAQAPIPVPIAPAAPVTATVPPSVEAFDEVVDGVVSTFVTKSKEIGDIVAEQATELKKAFMAQRKILLLATKSKKPDMSKSIYMEILKDLQVQMEAISQVKAKNPRTPFNNHLTMVADGAGQLGWVTVEPKPANFVKEMNDTARFWGDKIFKEYREKEPAHVEWVKSFYAIAAALEEYIKQNHAMGVSWNNKDGIAPEEALKQANAETASNVVGLTAPEISAPPAPPSGGPPGPPPPPPPSMLINPPPPPGPAPAAKSGGGDMGAVFDQLNKGSSVTSGLKKVTADMQTHKNPNLRTTAPAPPSRTDSIGSRGKSPAPGRPVKPQSMRTKKPPRKELEANKWFIENFDSPADMIEIEASLSHSILISRCEKTTIRIIGKANAISIDSSSRVSLIIDSLVSSVDVIKSPRFEMQVLGTLPTVLLDQVDGATIYLSKESVNTEVFTSKCTSINISTPEGEDGDYVECPLPEQIVTRIKNGKAVSEIVEHAG